MNLYFNVDRIDRVFEGDSTISVITLFLNLLDRKILETYNYFGSSSAYLNAIWWYIGYFNSKFPECSCFYDLEDITPR